MEKNDYAITLLSQAYRRRFMKFLTTERIKLETKVAKNELEVINKLKSKQCNVQYLVLDITFNIQTILTGINSEHKIPVLILHDNEYTQEKKDNLLHVYPHIYFHESVSLTLDILCDLLLNMKIEMSKIKVQTKERDRFTFIKKIGDGASGIVHLLQDNENNGKLVAVKIINTQCLEENSKLKVEREIELMKQVNVPSIIEFYESKTENDTKYIYMEYADGGSLDNKIFQAKTRGDKLDQNVIFDWMIEILIALYSMNLKDMIHRDIKSENILLSKGNAKLADLGISRVIKLNDVNKTYCGTPYYASPEMVLQKDYYLNTDVWSLGVVLYELVCLKKPFEGADNLELMKNIVNKKIVEYPQNIDQRLLILISIMLEKNPLLRLNVEDILKLDFVQDRLLTLIEEKQFKIDFLDKITSGKKCCVYQLMSLHKKNQEIDLALKLRQNCVSDTYNGGFFSSKVNDCYKGSELFSAVEELKVNDPLEKIENLLQLKILTEVSHVGKGFENEDNFYYKFSFDCVKEAKVNNYRILETQIPVYYDLLDLSCYALYNAFELRDLMIKEESDDIIFKSEFYLNFITTISFFRDHKIQSLKYTERIALLCNVYQIMIIHNSLNVYFNQIKQKGIMSYIKSTAEITYEFADFVLNNLEIKHAIFRGNKKPPENYLRLLNDNDPKMALIDFSNLVKEDIYLRSEDINKLKKEILFKCLFVAQELAPDFDILISYRYQIFTRYSVNEQLNEFMIGYCRNNMVFDIEHRTLQIPKCLRPYVSDFGSDHDFYSFFVVFHKIDVKENEKKEDVMTHELILKKMKKNIIKVSYV